MSSFSSVVRKGPKVAPRVAPRRNVVRKAPAPESRSPLHVESGTPADPPPPSSPALDENADTQPSLTLGQNTTSQSQQDVQSNRNQHLDTSDVPTRPVITSGEPPVENPNLDEISATNSTHQVSTNNEPQPDAEALATTALDGNTDRDDRERSGSQQLPVESRIGGDGDLPGRQETVTSYNDIQSTSAVSVTTNVPTSSVQARPSQGRKRKQPPHGSANIILSQPSISTTVVAPAAPEPESTRSPRTGRAASRTQFVTSQQSNTQLPTPENEFDRISSQLQAVQEATAAINARTRSANENSHPSTAISLTPPITTQDEPANQGNPARPRKRRRTNREPARTAEEQATEIVANAIGDTEDTAESSNKRVRGTTPEDAEEHEIMPEVTKMSDLCKDSKWGKKSETEKEMAANWDEILRRRKEDADDRLAQAALGSRRKANKGQTENQAHAGPAAVPVLHVENGVIVAGSRVVDRHAQAGGMADQVNESEIRDDKDIYKRVLATTIGCRNPIAPGQTWDDLATELFYSGLKKFGTDFQMISATIPGKTRKQVKLKYNVEERKNWTRVKRCLGMKEEVNLDEYAEATGVQFASVADVYKQMEEDEKRLREEDEQRRRDEGIISQDQPGEGGTNGDADGEGEGDADVALPSIEGGAEAAAREVVEAAMGGDRQSTASRVGSTTTARQTVQPAGKKKQTAKKSAATAKKGRQVAATKNKGFEGVEERIGDIE